MNDLVTFLQQQLDEDARVALDWRHRRHALTDQFMNDPRRKDVRLRREPVTDAQLSEYADDDRFGPDRQLAEVQAKQKTLARCQEEMLSGIPRLVHFAEQTLREMASAYGKDVARG